jgi:carbon monoxide dehydrogenase subunit G
MHKLYRYSAVALLALPGLLYAHGPSRLKVEKEIEINAPAEKVWAAIKDFCSIDAWQPAVAACESSGGSAKGATRVLTLEEPGSGKTIDEEMTAYDDATMTFKYKITKVDPAVLPVSSYAATMTVMPSGEKSKVVWKAGFYRSFTQNNPPPEQDDNAALNAITGFFDAGLPGIKQLVEGK